MKRSLLLRTLTFLMLGASILLLALGGGKEQKRSLTYNELMEYSRNGQVSRVTLGSGENVDVLLSDGTQATAPNPRSEDFKLALLEMNVSVREAYAYAPNGLWLILLALPACFLLFRRRGVPRLAKVGDVQADSRIPSVTFSDVAANGEALRCMRELVDFLKEPEKFTRYGARLPRGVMLYGPPGTGKTLLAKALAGEAKTPFFSMNGADFVQIYVGVGASRVRDLFKKARKAGGGVIFIDEIDAIGKKRDNGNDEREQTLNALLTEMSGFADADGVVVLAATNRLDTLDEALLRAGRFDRQIEVGLPDREERLKILKVHARNKPLADSVSLEMLARETALFSGAQLESLLNEAAIRAARSGGEKIEQNDVDAAYLNVLVGGEKEQSGAMETLMREKRVTAFHEAGHALLTHLLLPAHQVTRVSILPSLKGAAGYALILPEEKMFQSRQELCFAMMTALGGRAAEELAFGADQVTTGAAGDIRRARSIARKMAAEWEMGTGDGADKDTNELFKNAYTDAKNTLRAHWNLLCRLAETLLEKEQLNAREFLDLINDGPSAADTLKT